MEHQQKQLVEDQERKVAHVYESRQQINHSIQAIEKIRENSIIFKRL